MIASHAKLRKVRKFNKFKERKLKSYIDNLIRRNENCETILRVYWLYRKRGIGLPKHQSSAASWAGVLGAKPSRKTLFNISVLETFLESSDSNEPEGDSPETERLIAVKWRKRGVNDQTRKWQYNFTLYWQFYNSDVNFRLLLIANNTNQHKLTIFYIYIYIVSVYDSWIFFFFSLHLADSPFLPFYPISLSLAFSAYLSVHYVQSTYTCDPQLKSLNTTFRYIIIQKRSHGIYMVVSCAISISISDLNSRVEYYRYDPPCLSKWATIS